MADQTWTVKRILDWIEGFLARHDDPNPRLSAQWLVAEALDLSRMQLFLEFDRPLDERERSVLRDWTRRRADGVPLQYITGTVRFRHITVQVRRGVLIPRPETELLVSEALALLPAAPKPQDEFDAQLIRQFSELSGTDELEVSLEAAEADERPGNLLVADICTGSGCIACSIAHEHARTEVYATDIAPDAVRLARDNVEQLGLMDRVHVIECDLAQGLPADTLGALDLVVSNPPYVPTEVLRDIPREVADFEPMLALDGGADGLAVFERLLAWSVKALAPGGGFAFELHETCLDDAASKALAAGMEAVRIVKDLAGRPRILVGRKPR